MSAQYIELYLQSKGVKFETEYKFLKGRKFKFDFYVPDKKVAIEYEGIFCGKSRHTSVIGYSSDCFKYSMAAIQGIKVIRITAFMLKAERDNGYELIDKALNL